MEPLAVASEWAKQIKAKLSGNAQEKEQLEHMLAVAEEQKSIAGAPSFEDWRGTATISGFRGTLCKCGAHVSAMADNGGDRWLEEHVRTAHADAFDWKAAVKHALTLPTDECMEYLRGAVAE